MRQARIRGWLTTLSGSLVVAAAFALSLPGIQIARAGEPATASQQQFLAQAESQEFSRFLAQTGDASAQKPAEPASCGAAKANRASANSADLLGSVMRQMEAEAEREGHKGQVEVIVLNNRGYNYGAPTDPRIEQHWIERELGR